MDGNQMEGIAAQLIAMKNNDLELREQLIASGKLFDGYHRGMEELHNSNAELLDQIMDRIGYPTIAKVGAAAGEAVWLVIQHSISRPEFMKRCMGLLQQAVDENAADPIQLAYLTDRISVYQERPQLYGTQFDWDADGKLSPRRYDDLEAVDQRRKALGMNTLHQQTEIMRDRAQQENQSPPTDLRKRELEILEWKKRVGWIKS